MALTRDTLTERKVKIFLRMQKRLEMAWDFEDWKEAVLYPTLEKMKRGEGVLGLESGQLADIKIEKQ